MNQKELAGKHLARLCLGGGIVAIFISLLIISPSSASERIVKISKTADVSAKQLSEQLQAISPYIKTDDRGTQKLLRIEAKLAGVAPESIELGQKIVTITNHIYIAAVKNESPQNESIDFSFIEPLFKSFTAKTGAESSALATVLSPAWYSCQGLKSYPDPCPPRRMYLGLYFGSQSSAAKFLTDAGFHKTAGYACNNNPYDYTTTVSSSCGWRTFRTQANLRKDFSRWTFETQGPEPNPEILSYPWPVVWWGVYVSWWHRSYC